MTKTFAWLLVLIFAAVVVGGALYVRSLISAPNSPTTTYSNQYSYNNSIDTTSNSASESNNQPSTGQSTTTNASSYSDILNDPVTYKDPINPGIYYIGPHQYEGVNDPTASDNPPYVIQYSLAGKNFTIALLQEPLSSTRQTMEQFLMQHLGYTPDQMCQLNYTVAVPYSVSQIYAGQNLGFSFCPRAVLIP